MGLALAGIGIFFWNGSSSQKAAAQASRGDQRVVGVTARLSPSTRIRPGRAGAAPDGDAGAGDGVLGDAAEHDAATTEAVRQKLI